MEYFGAEHYYFWQGAEIGQIRPRIDLERTLDDLVALDTPIAERCREAYLWGFCWGKVLTSTEYYDILGLYKPSEILKVQTVREPKPKVKRVIKKPIPNKSEQERLDEILKDLNKDFPVKGNC